MPKYGRAIGTIPEKKPATHQYLRLKRKMNGFEKL